MSAPSTGPPKLLAWFLSSPYVILCVVPLLWSNNWIVGRGFSELPAFALAILRWTIALLILVPYCGRQLIEDWPVIRRHWRWTFIAGASGSGLLNALVYLGLKYTTVTNGVLLNSFAPVMILLFSAVVLRHRISLRQWGGVALSLAGVTCIVTQGDLRTIATLELNPGDLLILANLVLWSIYTVSLTRRPEGIRLRSFVLAAGVIGWATLLPMFLVEFLMGYRMEFSLRNLAGATAIAVSASVLSVFLWNRAVDLVGPSVAGLYSHLMPVYGTFFAWLFFGERLYLFHLAGVALIVVGLVFTSWRRPPTRAEREAPAEMAG